MQIGIGIGITNLRNRTAFNALMLFQNSEQGVAFEPDPNTCFTDTAGMTPAGVGDAVALMLDKSQGLVLGPELVTNGTFDTDLSGWTDSSIGTGSIAFDSGTMLLTSNGNSDVGVTDQSIATVVGQSYKLQVEITATKGAKNSFKVGSSQNGAQYGSVTEIDAGLQTFHFIATSTVLWFRFNGYFGTGTTNINNISVRELPGLHKTQPDAASRPLLQDNPYRLVYSDVDDFMRVVFPNELTNATVAYADPGVGAVISTGQTIAAGNYDWSTDNAALIIVDRPLTATETTNLTAHLNKRAGV